MVPNLASLLSDLNVDDNASQDTFTLFLLFEHLLLFVSEINVWGFYYQSLNWCNCCTGVFVNSDQSLGLVGLQTLLKWTNQLKHLTLTWTFMLDK